MDGQERGELAKKFHEAVKVMLERRGIMDAAVADFEIAHTVYRELEAKYFLELNQ